MFVGIGVGVHRQRFAGSFATSYSFRVIADGGTIEALDCVAAASSLLQSASLLLIPSGYKAGVAYAELPANGNGDLTWFRNSVANRTQSNGNIGSVAANVPRLSYMYGSCPALLLEPQRTNLALWSEQFDNAGFWTLTNSGTITANTTISPDGTQNADTLNAGANNAQVQGVIVGTSGAAYTVSIWVKRITGTGNVFLRAVENADTLIAVTSDWQRFTATVTSTSTSIRIGVKLATSGDAVAIWGGQIEQGAYATTYIQTGAATATRVGDYFRRSNIRTNGLISASGGTWYVELRGNVSLTADSAPIGFWLGTNLFTDNSNGTIYFRQGGGSQRTGIWKYEGGSGSVMYATTTDTVKLAIKWNGTTADIFANGTKVVTATSFTATNMEFLAIPSSGIGRTFFIQTMALYPTPLSDADCQTLTT